MTEALRQNPQIAPRRLRRDLLGRFTWVVELGLGWIVPASPVRAFVLAMELAGDAG